MFDPLSELLEGEFALDQDELIAKIDSMSQQNVVQHQIQEPFPLLRK